MKIASLMLSLALGLTYVAHAADKPVIRLGARVFTEQTVLANLTAQYLATKGYDVQITGFDPDSASGQSNLGPDDAP